MTPEQAAKKLSKMAEEIKDPEEDNCGRARMVLLHWVAGIIKRRPAEVARYVQALENAQYGWDEAGPSPSED